jgi:hypothetical protein
VLDYRFRRIVVLQSHTILVQGSALVSGYIGYYYNTRECDNLGLSSFNVALALLIKIGLVCSWKDFWLIHVLEKTSKFKNTLLPEIVTIANGFA